MIVRQNREFKRDRSGYCRVIVDGRQGKRFRVGDRFQQFHLCMTFRVVQFYRIAGGIRARATVHSDVGDRGRGGAARELIAGGAPNSERYMGYVDKHDGGMWKRLVRVE